MMEEPFGAGAAIYGRRFVSPFLFRRGLLNRPSPKQGEGVDTMVTYAELFQFTLVIIGIIGLIVQITKKK